MIDTLSIGKYIYNTLNQSENITCKIYPLVADNDAKFPFIIYKRVNLNSLMCKDGLYEDEATVEINVVTDKYSIGIEVANQVRELLESQTLNYQGLEITESRLMQASEEYNNGAFVQRLQFNFKINN
jgi:hypothetical protein